MHIDHHPPRSAGGPPRRCWAAITSIAIALATIGATTTANALAPANDNYADRTTIQKGAVIDIPFAEATLEPVDSEAFVAACGIDFSALFPAMQTVWFDYTPTVSETVELSFTLDSGGIRGTGVVSGDPGSFTGVSNCNNPFVDVVAGVTYHVGVVDVEGSSSTGHLSIATAPPPPTMAFTIDSTGTIDQSTNFVGLSGTYTCTGAAGTAAFVRGSLSQLNGRLRITSVIGLESLLTQCDGAAHPWSGTGGGDYYSGTSGLVRPGTVTVTMSGTACDGRCTFTPTTTTKVQLRSVKPATTPAPPPPSPATGTVRVDRTATLDRATNLLTISGTLNCTGGDEAFISANARQVSTGGVFVDAIVYGDLGTCNGTTQRWTITAPVATYGLVPDLLSGGTATLSGWVGTCNFDTCTTLADVNTKVDIKATGRPTSPSSSPLPGGIAVNFDRRARLDTTTNTATVTGSISCTGFDDVQVEVDEVAQLVGKVHVRSTQYPFQSMPCDGLPHALTITATADNGLFAGGRANVSVALGWHWTDADGFLNYNGGVFTSDVRLVPVKATK